MGVALQQGIHLSVQLQEGDGLAQQVFLDDVSLDDVERELGVPVTVVDQDGFDLLDAMLARK